jgi:hypothetical protein
MVMMCAPFKENAVFVTDQRSSCRLPGSVSGGQPLLPGARVDVPVFPNPSAAGGYQDLVMIKARRSLSRRKTTARFLWTYIRMLPKNFRCF